MAEAQWQIQISAVDGTAAAFSSLQQRMKQAQGVMEGVTKSIDAVKTAAAGFAGLEAVKWFRDTAKAAAEVEELGKKLGFTSDQVEAIQKSSTEAGQSFDQQTEYFKTHRAELEKMTAAYKAQGQIMSGPMRSAFADVNQQIDVFGRTITTVRASFEGGTLDKSIGLIANMIKDMGASLAYFEVYKGTITSVRELMAMFTGAGAITGVTAEMRATKQIDELRASSVDATVALQKAQSELKNLEQQPAVNNPFARQRDAIMGGTSGPLETARRRVAEAQALSDQANKQLADAEKAFEKGKKAIDAAQESPAIKVPEWPKPTGGASVLGDEPGERKLAVLLAERAALERAMQTFTQKFDIRQADSVEEVEKRLQRTVDLEKQIATLTKNVPKDSPVAKAIAEEATNVSDLRAQWEEYRRVVVGAEGTIAKYGDGSKELNRALTELNKQLAAGKITQDEYNYAAKAAADTTKQQELAARGAAGGFGGFAAGIESVLRPASLMSREFQYGQKAMNLLDDAITQMVNNGEVNFNRLLASFITMIAQMEMRAAVSSIWKAAGGDSGSGGGSSGFGGIIGGIVSIGSAFFKKGGGGAPVPNFLETYADGGRPSVNKVSLVGERGPELFVPDSAGTILTNDQLNGLGGGDSVAITMNNSFGGGVTHAEMLRYGAMIEERARAGAMAGIEAKRKRGGSIKQVFRG